MDDCSENPPSETPPHELPQPQLDSIQARILGCLIEKAALTPDVYPMTVNAVVAACNQKSSREPLMNLEIGAVGHALRAMEALGLTKLDPFAQRAARYSHRFEEVYAVTARQKTLLALLLLRGAQTLNELLTRSERLSDFPSVDDVLDTLDRLITKTPALVVRLPRGNGRREDRYMHVLSGPIDTAAVFESAPRPSTASSGTNELAERVTRLESDVARLREEIARLISPSEPQH